MKCLVLDTDLLVGFLRGEERAVRFLDSLWGRGEEPALSSIVVYELYRGAVRRGRRHVEAVRELERLLPVLPLDGRAARLAAEMEEDLRRRGLRVDVRDLLIAATAMANGCGVATCNVRHFGRVEALRVEKWC